ncbi:MULTISPECIES: SDR family oxidoreductase [unclassified Streptomyces]|uniref:SDR family oxidoreductase n=1 Tax=unclassified Streptomyces TaxID=2593676 RepID=UPI002E8248E7|nr:SDR family oxidoreductase [Streptomyces sp. NBC_00589]WTI34612.1 SDR family oxidoreductase [Streptomyces sp. NBC_00775]WUB31716.1 SDR family oxidoreductase [Streptomyces sp. NBC_00589]
MTSTTPLTVLVVGATGSIGTLVVAEALRQGHQVKALVRDPGRARTVLPQAALLVTGDLTDADTLKEAVDGIDAVVFTHGSHGRPGQAELIDYGAVRNTLTALGDQAARISLMTAIGVTGRPRNADGTVRDDMITDAHAWKRRGERLVRASGRPYTIVRPGWFDYNAPGQLALTMLQGDTRHAGDPSDGVIARRQIAQVLVSALTSPEADHKTLELVAEHGPAPSDLAPLFAALTAEVPGSLDAALDSANMPLDAEPAPVRQDLEAVRHA